MAQPLPFRLEVVHRLRRLELEREQRSMARCLQAVLDAQRLEQLVAERIAESAGQRRDLQSAAHPDIHLLCAEQLHALSLRRMRDEAAHTIAERQTLMDEQRHKLVAASRRVKALDKLRERQAQRHAEHERRREQKQDDEFALRCRLEFT